MEGRIAPEQRKLDQTGDEARHERRIGRARDAHFREAPMAENHRVVERDVQRAAEGVGDHVDRRAADPHEIAADRRVERHHDAARHQDQEIDALRLNHRRRVPAQRDHPEPERDQQQDQRPRGERQPEPLHGGAHALRGLFGPVVMRGEGARVTGQRLEKADQRVRQNAGRQRRLNGHAAVARQENAVAELHDRVRRHAEDQRRGDAPHLAVAARRRRMVRGTVHGRASRCRRT